MINSWVADITEAIGSTPSGKQRSSINTPTAVAGTSSRSPLTPGVTSQTDWTHSGVPSPASGIAGTPTPIGGREHLPTVIPDPEARAISTHPLRTRSTESNQRETQWHLQPQAESIPPSVVSGSRSLHGFGYSDMTRTVFPTGRHLELYICNRQLFMSASDLAMVSYAPWRIVEALAESPHRPIMDQYWNTAMWRNNIWSIAFEAHTKEILKEIWWSNGPRCILHSQTCTRFQPKSITLNPISFNQHGTT